MQPGDATYMCNQKANSPANPFRNEFNISHNCRKILYVHYHFYRKPNILILRGLSSQQKDLLILLDSNQLESHHETEENGILTMQVVSRYQLIQKIIP